MGDDFQRHPSNGAPYVNHPFAVTKSGRPSRVMYGRPSNFGAQIEDRYGITRWSERHVLCGATQLGPSIHGAIAALDPDDETERKILDTYVMDAKEAAGAMLAAKRGTHTHLLTEQLDRGEDSPLSVIAAGDAIDIDTNVSNAVLACWSELLDRYGLKILAVEQTVVDDKWRLAGTLDRVAETTIPIKFNGMVIPARCRLVLDVKTGRIRVGSDGQPIYWHAYSVQVASYAQSVPYYIDALKEERRLWPWRVSQKHALIAHVDVGNAIDEGVATASLWHVNLAAGRRAGNLARAARDWQNGNGLFLPMTDTPVVHNVADGAF